MSGGGGDAPPANGGEFLLQLLRKPPNSHPTPPPPQTFSHDPAIAAVGPSAPNFPPPHAALRSNPHNFPYCPWNLSLSPPFGPHTYFQQNPNVNPNLNPDFASPPAGLSYASHQFNIQPSRNSPSDERRNLGFVREVSKPNLAHPQERDLIFGSLNLDGLQIGAGNFTHDSLGQRNQPGSSHRGDNLGKDSRLNGLHINPVGINEKARGNDNNGGKPGQNGNYKMVVPPPGFSSQINHVGDKHGNGRRTFDHNADKGKGNFVNSDNRADFVGPLTQDNLRSDPGYAIKGMLELHSKDGDNGQELRDGGRGKMSEDRGGSHLDDLEDQLVSTLGLEDESAEKNDKKKHHRDKDYRSDKRGQWIMGQRMRNQKSFTSCRSDINRLNAPFLSLFESLIPPDEEKLKQKQLLTILENLVCKEWPEARLYLYGSCANSFGFSKSDIDVCLAMELGNVEKSEVLLKLADIFLSDNLQNVQALTRARVPIVKLMDPVTGISCDICINNVLAVVNTKLLRDYAKIDSRLRQLVFLVKHWAKSRGVNETYHGTLSSYAYVLMCIHFLQQRTPAILPCLQGMEITYYANVDNVECAYFDQVDKLCNFGSQNRESIAQLVWGFFQYWAYCHDYANDVISVRTGHTISKRVKDWTRRVGNDRHLICIEDPFEVSHDLGRVVDKFSIRVLREEFERAAHIMQYDPNPCVTLFEAYISD